MNKGFTNSGFPSGDAAAYFSKTAIRYRIQGSPFYEALALRCAEDEELMTLAAEAQTGQPYTHLFFGVINYLLMGAPNDPLASYYGMTGKAPVANDETFAALKDFCRRRRDEIAGHLRTRTVQFTQPNRANFVPVLLGHAMRKGAKEPLSLIEVGCSAGFLTVFDKYYMDFGPLGRLGDPSNPRVSTASFEGDRKPPVPDHMPRIAERVGIDLAPVDPSDPDERRWIEALLPPDLSAERRELREALDMRARIPLKTLKGDAMRIVPEVLPQMTGSICVLHSYCLYQWPPALQNSFDQMLREASKGRTIYRVGVDHLYEHPARPNQGPPDAAAELVMDMTAVTYRDGEAEWEYLGVADTWARRAVWAA